MPSLASARTNARTVGSSTFAIKRSGLFRYSEAGGLSADRKQFFEHLIHKALVGTSQFFERTGDSIRILSRLAVGFGRGRDRSEAESLGDRGEEQFVGFHGGSEGLADGDSGVRKVARTPCVVVELSYLRHEFADDSEDIGDAVLAEARANLKPGGECFNDLTSRTGRIGEMLEVEVFGVANHPLGEIIGEKRPERAVLVDCDFVAVR